MNAARQYRLLGGGSLHASQPKEFPQGLRRRADMVEILEVGLSNLELVTLIDLHARETVTSNMEKGRRPEHAIWRSRVHQHAL